MSSPRGDLLAQLFTERVFSGVALVLTIIGSLLFYGERISTIEEKVANIEVSSERKDAVLLETLKQLNLGVNALNVTVARLDERLGYIEKKPD